MSTTEAPQEPEGARLAEQLAKAIGGIGMPEAPARQPGEPETPGTDLHRKAWNALRIAESAAESLRDLVSSPDWEAALTVAEAASAERERIAAECEARAAYPGSTRIQKAAFLAAAAVARGEYTPISERRSGGYDSSFDGPVL